jgi:predicted component of type VI protein secretion system
MYQLTNTSAIIRLSDNATIPNDPANTDYAEYLEQVKTNTPFPADIPVKTYAPLSAWQVRKVLTQFNLRVRVEAAISQADQNTKDAWQYASSFERDNEVLLAMGEALGMSDTQLDSMFEIGITL